MIYKARIWIGLMLATSLFVASCAGPASPTAPVAVAPTSAPVVVAPTSAPGQPTVVPPAASPTPYITITEWDYQSMGENVSSSTSTWLKMLRDCEPSTGVAIDRQWIPDTELQTKIFLGAQQHQLPGLLMVDNSWLQQVADTGALAPVSDYGVDMSGLFANVVDSQMYKGKAYGVLPGINGLAIFYNKDMFAKAGLQPPTTWAEVESDAAALTKPPVYGIAFAAVAAEGGPWQFLPWFWGAGADLSQLDSPQAVKALQFWVDLVHKGYASKSVLAWDQGPVNDQFLAGNAAMEENGNWNLPDMEKSKINFGVVPIPKPDGGAAPGPMGGEGLTIPLNSDPAVMKAAGKIINCVLTDKEMLEWAAIQAYIPSRISLATQAGQADPKLLPFVQAAPAFLTRTGPPANLGARYLKVCKALWTAIQAAVSGTETAQDALTKAQQQATSP